MITRKEYMNPRQGDDKARYIAHREYYAQFVGHGTRALVQHRIGLARLKESKDLALNDIPLSEWDSIGFSISGPTLNSRMIEHGDCVSMAGLVCIAKEAARQIIDELE